MGDFRPLLFVVLSLALLGGFLSFFISPFIDSSSPAEGSFLSGFVSFVEDGFSISINLPIFGNISTNISPITWLWFGINGVTDFIVEQLTLFSYIPDPVLIPLIVIFILSLGYSIVTLIRGN